MKLPRPYIPLSVRFIVARRQFIERVGRDQWMKHERSWKRQNERDRLGIMLDMLFLDEPFHLDHDPALCNREYNPKTKQYVPDANDPNYLTYVNAESHRVKTFIKGEGARRSDMGQRRYLKRVIARRNPKPRFKPRAAKQIRRIPHASVTTNNGD